ncbi:MAG: hypothetical protein Q7U10_03000 [Thermodesulfovibrionia bacterium]|nr:hypothetical protein [Thermodesulfovibrionia bacterium]
MIVRNEDIQEIIAEIPEGHRHIRTTVKFKDGIEYTFQEAAIAGIVRAFIEIKTHPTRKKIHLVNRHLLERKDGYAEWQLVEE